jgi:hypothetical protein
VSVLLSPEIKLYGGGKSFQSFVASCRTGSSVSLEYVDSVYVFLIVKGIDEYAKGMIDEKDGRKRADYKKIQQDNSDTYQQTL